MPESKIKAGSGTSEYERARAGGAWAIVAMALGVMLSIGSAVAQSFDVGSKAGIIAGAILAAAGVMQRTLVDLGYIKSRTEVKSKKD